METNNIQLGKKDGATKLVEYITLTEADTPEPITAVEFADRSVQIVGTFNGGTVVVQGSNNGTDWVTLTDPQGNPLTFTGARLEQIQELTRFIRPLASSGTGISVDVFFVLRQASSIRT